LALTVYLLNFDFFILCIKRSRLASASVLSPMLAYHWSVGSCLFVLVVFVVPGKAHDDLFQANVFSTHQHFTDGPTVPITFIRFDDHEAMRSATLVSCPSAGILALVVRYAALGTETPQPRHAVHICPAMATGRYMAVV